MNVLIKCKDPECYSEEFYKLIFHNYNNKGKFLYVEPESEFPRFICSECGCDAEVQDA